MTPISVLAFGGCQLGVGLAALRNSGSMTVTTDAIGLDFSVYTMSEAHQRIRFWRGETEIPRSLRYFCNLPDDFDPLAANARNAEQADLVLIEPNTTLDMFFDGYALHRTQIAVRVLQAVEAADKNLRNAGNEWWVAVFGRERERQRRAAEAIIPALAGVVPDVELARALLLDAHGREQTFDEYLSSVAELRDMFKRPIGLVTFIYQYLPDGRPVAWPADFLENTLEVATRLDLPVFDSAALVREHGVATALDEERRVYNREFYPVAGQAFLDFSRHVLDRHAVKSNV